MRKLEGLLGPVVSTFSADGDALDVAAFAANLRAHLVAGLDGILVAGSTGEAALLDASERAALVETARDVVPRDKLLLVSTGAEPTKTCIQLTRDAAERGADGVLVVAPHYYGPVMTAPALTQHYQRVADASPVPVVMYNIPKYMHFSLAPQLVAELAMHQNIVGIKDSSGDASLLSAYLNAQSDTFSVVLGGAHLWQFALESGANGGILGAALFATSLCVEVQEAVARGDKAATTALQARLTPLHKKIVGELGVAGVKAAMDRVGLNGGPVRSPLTAITGAQSVELDSLLKSELVAV